MPAPVAIPPERHAAPQPSRITYRRPLEIRTRRRSCLPPAPPTDRQVELGPANKHMPLPAFAVWRIKSRMPSLTKLHSNTPPSFNLRMMRTLQRTSTARAADVGGFEPDRADNYASLAASNHRFALRSGTDAKSAHAIVSGPDAAVSGGSLTTFALSLHEFAANAEKSGPCRPTKAASRFYAKRLTKHSSSFGRSEVARQ